MTVELRFPPVPDPACTLIMVIYGGYLTALRSLRAIRDTAGDGYELLVVDNASPDGAGRRLSEAVEGARFILNDRNLGYGPAVNGAALQARGGLIGVLNSDIEPLDGWLPGLVDALETDPRAGVAVPAYLNPDGSLQEAGVLLGRDGRGYGYGDRMPADAPEAGFARYVDYGSAAAALVRREAFERVGGFDARYGLGYYEDADLSFALRELGYLTVFDPRSRVIHAGQGSFTGRDRIRRAEQNRVAFADRFPAQLDGRPRLSRPPYDPHRELIVRDWWAPGRVLVVDRDGRLGPLAARVQELRPLDRVTHLAGAVTGPGHRFVETIPGPTDPRRWLSARRHHYSVVAYTADLPGAIEAAVIRSQPQARRVAVDPATDPAQVADRIVREGRP